MAVHKAWRLHSYGGPETFQLDEVPMPNPGKGEILVKIHLAGINPFDWKIREGYVKDAWPLPLPFILGVDFVGTVAGLGAGSSRFKVGDRVMTMSDKLGAFAEHIVVDENILATVPKDLSDEQAASLPMPTLTAWQALHTAGQNKPGQTVLIHGASGICGAFAVQFAKAEGMKVIGTASGKNKGYVLGLGADEFVDYQTDNFENRVKDVDLVLDFVLMGGVSNTTDRSWTILKSDGALVSVADPGVTTKVPAGRKGFFFQTRADVTELENIAQKVLKGEIKSKVGRVFRRDQLVEAMELNKAGGTTGRLLVNFQQA
ncbi:hypothetical protein AMS68_002189 [Peltaster fructicola]|uniref:Enoyl reductase (ER) domain-containing protein n=1 Tax=Peltaster fructicola TaxID=286661 RepID=A0A6H0XPI1_9PEZI|nr:hypothetical protein AMS68_002189 [Peltaster fructicola]